jgi:hypothetical protein
LGSLLFCFGHSQPVIHAQHAVSTLWDALVAIAGALLLRFGRMNLARQAKGYRKREHMVCRMHQ